MAQFLGDAVIWIVVAGWLPALVIGGSIILLRRLPRAAPKPPAPPSAKPPWLP